MNLTFGIFRRADRAPGAVAAVLLVSALLTGCGASSLTSGFLGGSAGETATLGVDEKGLLDAAKQDAPAAQQIASTAATCPQFIVPAKDREIFRYEPGREGDNLGIIHRGEIMQTARECQLQPGRMTIKYGFSGRVLLGPRGQPGPVSMPVNVSVVAPDQQAIQTVPAIVSTEITPENPIGYFSNINTVVFEFPEGARPADYRLIVGFDNAPPDAAAKKKKG